MNCPFQSLNIYCNFFSDIQVLAFGITDLVDNRFLAAISGDISAPSGTQTLGYDYFSAPNFQALNNVYNALTSSICREPEQSMRLAKFTNLPNIIYFYSDIYCTQTAQYCCILMRFN